MSSTTLLFFIVIPTYNRPQQLASCLHGINELTYSRDRFEVIVVDDGSHTPLESIVNAVSDRVAVKLIIQSNSGPAVARNHGAAVSTRGFSGLHG